MAIVEYFDVQNRGEVAIKELYLVNEVLSLGQRIGGGAEKMISPPTQARIPDCRPVFLKKRIQMRGTFRGFDKSKVNILLSYLLPVDGQLVARDINSLNSKIYPANSVPLTGSQQEEKRRYGK